MADFLPTCTTSIINIKHGVVGLLEDFNVEKDKEENWKNEVQKQFEIDISESVGLSHQGNNILENVNKTSGMLGLLQIMKVFERSTKLYDSCMSSDDIENGDFADNTLMHNLLYIC